MKAFKFFLVFLSATSLAFILLAWYSGFFKTAEVEVKKLDSFVAVYEDHAGSYDRTARIQEDIYNRLWDDGIENYRAFAIFFDDPRSKAETELRSRVGCIVEPAYEQKIKNMDQKYQVFNFEKQRCAVVEFPYRNVFSVYAAVYKAYPALEKFRTEQGTPAGNVIEIYEIPHRIVFAMPLDNSRAVEKSGS